MMNRGDRRKAIFRDTKDRARFLTTLDEVCLKTEWQVEHRRPLDDREVLNQVRRGWCLGNEDFRKDLLARMHAKMGGITWPERRETAQAKAERLGAGAYAASCVRALT